MANTPIPPQATPLVASTGAMSEPWYKFQLSLFENTGGTRTGLNDAFVMIAMEGEPSLAPTDDQISFAFLNDEPAASFVNPPFVNLNRWLFAPGYAVPSNGTDALAGITALVTEANAYATANGGAEIVLPGTYAVSGEVLLTNSRTHFTGRGANGGLAAIGAGTFTTLRLALGASHGSTTVSVNASRGAKLITVASAAAAIVGRAVSVESWTGYTVGANDRRGYTTFVEAVSGSDVTLADALPFDIDASRQSSVVFMTFGEAPVIADLALDGTNATGAASPMRSNRLLNPKFSNIRSQNFTNAAALGQFHVNFYGGHFENLIDRGSGGGSDAIDFYLGGGGSRIAGIRSYNSLNFGVGAEYLGYCNLSDIVVRNAIGRGFKLYGCCQNKFTRVSSNENFKTGLAVTGGSQYNKFVEVETIGNTEHGIWQNGTDNWCNEYDVVRSQFNNRAGASWVDISAANFIPTGVGVDHDMDDRHCAFTNIAPNINVATDVGTITTSVSTSITLSRRPYMCFSRKSAFNAKPSAAHSIANNTLTTVLFDTVANNQNGNYDGATSIFTAPLPGLYQFNARVQLSAVWGSDGAIHFAINNVLTTGATIAVGVSENAREISISRYLNAGDNVRVQILQNSGGALTLSTTDYRTSFDGAMV